MGESVKRWQNFPASWLAIPMNPEFWDAGGRLHLGDCIAFHRVLVNPILVIASLGVSHTPRPCEE